MRRTLAALLLLVALAACGGGKDPAAVTTPDPTPNAVAAATTGVDIPGFIAALRQKYPALTEGRNDKALRNDAINTCASIRAGETKAVLNRDVAARFGSHDGKAPTRIETSAILALLTAHGCTRGTSEA
jgi:hypothetical protein